MDSPARPNVLTLLFGSRKVWVALGSVVASILAGLNLPQSIVTPIVTLIGAVGTAVILGIGYEDGKQKGNMAIPPRVNALLLGGALLGLLLCGGCQQLTTAPQPYVAADRATFEAIAPEYELYVKNDPQLDQAQKDRRERTLATWRLRIESMERSSGAATQPATRPAAVQPAKLPRPDPRFYGFPSLTLFSHSVSAPESLTHTSPVSVGRSAERLLRRDSRVGSQPARVDLFTQPA